MDTHTLQTFITLAEEKNFTRAAAQLYVAQSTVTNRIAQLEDEVGQPLVVRGNKSVSLTEAGKVFLKYAEKIVRLESAVMRELSPSEINLTPLRIGTNNTFYQCHLFPAIRHFIPAHPEMAHKITMGHSLELLQLLQEDQLDITFTYTPLRRPDYTCELFNTEKLLLVTRSDKNEYPDGIHQEELANLYYVFCNFALKDVGIFIRELFPPLHQFPFEIDNLARAVDYLLDGIGATFLPETLAEEHLKAGDLSVIPLLDFNTPEINCYVTYRSGNSFDELLDEIRTKGGSK